MQARRLAVLDEKRWNFPPRSRRNAVSSWHVAMCLVAAMIGCFAPGPAPPPASIRSGPGPGDQGLAGSPGNSYPSQSPAGPGSSGPGSPVISGGHPWPPAVAAREWKYIVFHHTASNSGSVDTIHQSHLQRKDEDGHSWRGIGYHFVIGNGQGMGDGAIEPTFRWREQSAGAHAGVGEYNTHGIGICLVGDFDKAPPTAAQLAAAKRLVSVLKAQHGIDSARVVRHGDVKATACPGKLFPFEEVAQAAAVW